MNRLLFSTLLLSRLGIHLATAEVGVSEADPSAKACNYSEKAPGILAGSSMSSRTQNTLVDRPPASVLLSV